LPLSKEGALRSLDSSMFRTRLWPPIELLDPIPEVVLLELLLALDP